MRPYAFDEFFASGKEETISPFLTPDSRSWGKNLSLKSALAAAFCLLSAFILSYIHAPSSHLLLLTVYFLSGTPALLNAIHDLRNFEINIDVLMTLAALLSVLIGSGFEGALLLVLFELSGSMEESVSKKTKSALLQLHALSPHLAFVIEEDGTLIEKSVKEIDIGARLLIKAGEVIPLDGIVEEGSSFLNLFHLTGENEPVPKKKGDAVPAGATNLDGTLTLSVVRTSSDSTLSRIILLITEAQEAKPRVQQFLDKFSKRYATTIISLFFLFALTLPLFFSMPYLTTEGSIYRALTFLIAASPCALIIGAPTAYLSAISACAKKGILLKGGVTLDSVAGCHTVAFDKTGTLTTGSLTCTEMRQEAGPPFDPQKALAIASTLERHSSHPIASAITAYALEKGAAPLPLQDFQSVPGFGLTASIEGYPVAIGHAGFIASKTTLPLSPKSQVETYLLVQDTVFAFSFTDTVRSEAKITLETLRELGLRLVMLSGDSEHNALAVGQAIGITEIFAGLRPEDKLEKVSHFSETEGLMMVGDGINDAPALARASVGISMGKIGSQTAVEASDIVFLNDDLALLPWLYKKAQKTVQLVRQNVILALSVICFASTPALLGWIPLWLAVILHEGGTLIVGLNSLRLLRSK